MVFEGVVAALVELETGVVVVLVLVLLLFLGSGLDGRDVVFGTNDLVGGFGGTGEHLDDLLEGVGVGLDEGGRVRVSGVGSGHGFWGLGSWCCWGSLELESINVVVVVVVAVGAACAAVWGGQRVWVWIGLSSGRDFH